MYNNAPADYDCPLCQTIRGEENPDPWTKLSDIFYRDDDVISWVNQKWWGTIEGNVVVIPVEHVENIFDMPDDLAGKIHGVARRVAMAMRELYGCPGISTRQHNGSEGNQDVWHYHLHVFPRYAKDDLYGKTFRLASVDERASYADRLREWFS